MDGEGVKGGVDPEDVASENRIVDTSLGAKERAGGTRDEESARFFLERPTGGRVVFTATETRSPSDRDICERVTSHSWEGKAGMDEGEAR